MSTKDKEPGTSVVAWREEMAKHATEVAQTEQVSGAFISFKGGVMTFNNQPIPNNRMSVVVLDYIFENTFYEGRYNPTAPASPACFAFARSDSELAPHKDSEKPQNPACDGCARNQWGSDLEGGKGKACKNSRRLAFIHADSLKDPTLIAKADIAFAKLPVTSVRNWSNYASQIASVLKMPPIGVVTQLAAVPDPKNQFQVTFSMVNPIADDEILGALWARKKAIADTWFTPYTKNQAVPTGAGAPAGGKF